MMMTIMYPPHQNYQKTRRSKKKTAICVGDFTKIYHGGGGFTSASFRKLHKKIKRRNNNDKKEKKSKKRKKKQKQQYFTTLSLWREKEIIK